MVNHDVTCKIVTNGTPSPSKDHRQVRHLPTLLYIDRYTCISTS